MKKQKLLNALHSSFVFRSLSLLFVLSFSVLQTNAQVFKTEEVEQLCDSVRTQGCRKAL